MLRSLAILLCCAARLGAQPATLTTQSVTITELPQEDCYYIHGVFGTSAPADQVWRVLSDYQGLQGVLSSLRSSRILERNGDSLLLEQVMDGQFLFFHKDVRIRLEVREQPPWRIDFSQQGDKPFRHYAGAWQVEPVSGGCRVDYTLSVSRGDMAPRFLERKLFRDNSQGLLQELRAEVTRRAVQAPVAQAKVPAGGGL